MSNNRLVYDIGIGANWIGFFSGKSLLGLVFRLGLGVVFGLGCIRVDFVGDWVLSVGGVLGRGEG